MSDESNFDTMRLIAGAAATDEFSVEDIMQEFSPNLKPRGAWQKIAAHVRLSSSQQIKRASATAIFTAAAPRYIYPRRSGYGLKPDRQKT